MPQSQVILKIERGGVMSHLVCLQICPVVEFYLIDRVARSFESVKVSLSPCPSFQGRFRRLQFEKDRHIYMQVFGGRGCRCEEVS